MIIVDRELRRAEEEGRPIRLALVGVGAIGHAVAFQVLTVTPGIQLVALCNRTVEKAEQAYRDAGVSDIARVDSVPITSATSRRPRRSLARCCCATRRSRLSRAPSWRWWQPPSATCARARRSTRSATT